MARIYYRNTDGIYLPISEGVTDEQIQNAVDAYLTENPVEVSGSGIMTVYDTTLTEDVTQLSITKDSNGNAFSYKMLWVYVYTPKLTTEVSGARALLSIGSATNNVMYWNLLTTKQNYAQACGYPGGITECFVNGDYQAANHTRAYHKNNFPYTQVTLRSNAYAVADARIPAGTIIKVWGMN